MSPDHPAIRVSHLGKKYIIGGPQEKYLTFRDAIVNSVKAPFRRLSSSEPLQEFWALKDVSFDVEQGEVVGIIGRNGAGKSTLLKILSRITSPSEGTVDLYGRVGSLLEVGTGFHPELTGRENIFLSGSILGMKKREIEGKLDEIVKFSEIEKFLDTPAKRYSSGMYVRLAFAVAAYMDTEILLVDEVLAVGDASFQKKCLGKMGDVAAKDGRTVLFVSHNMGAVSQLTHRSILLELGKIMVSGKTEDIIDQYLNHPEIINSNVYDLSDLKNRYPDTLSRTVEFVKAELLTENNTNFFRSDSPITLRLTVKGNQSVKNFRFSLTIFQVSGNPVGSTFAQDTYSIKKGETATFYLTLNNLRLSQGQYYCGIATGEGNNLIGHKDFDIIMNVLFFNILPQVNDVGTQSFWTSGWGSITFDNPVIKKMG
jgi:lipopolysaccharide transport system ATP-binding protein